MATRRKYRTGGAVIPPDDAEAAAPAMPPSPSGDDALKAQVDAARNAEALHREAAERDPQASPVDDRIKTFLRQNPHVLLPQNTDAVHWHRAIAQREGVEDGSDEMHRRILNGIQEEQELLRQRRAEMAGRATPAATVPPISRPADIDEAAAQLGRHAAAIGALANAAASAPEGIAENPPPMPKPAPADSFGKVSGKTLPGISMSGTRNVPSLSTGRGETSGRVTLTAEERDMARRSMPWLEPADAERTYAANKAKYQGMKDRGETQ
jgi:hypothetical protein